MAEMQSARITLPREHPSYAGHFPGQPVLPGVVLLAEVLELLLREAPRLLGEQAQLGAVKFLAPLRPGAGMEIRWTAAGARVRFEVWRHAEGDPVQGLLAASGQLQGSGAGA